MDRVIDVLNASGQAFCAHAGRAFVQSSILIGVLLVLDLLLRRRVRAVVRYGIWLLVFVKLLLPPALALPTGIGYYRSQRPVTHKRIAEAAVAAPVETIGPSSVPLVTRAPATVDIVDLAVHPIVTTTPATLPASFRPAMVWQAWVFLGWCVGVLILGVCLMRRFQYVRKLVRQSVSAPEPLSHVLAQCAEELGLRRCPQLRLSDDVPGPVVCGLLPPVVLMPTTLGDKVSEERLRTVLVHEMAHIKRGDLWVNFIQTLLLVAYFYHPLLWLVNAIVRRLREQAVDEMVLVALDAEAAGYSTTLIDLAEMTFTKPILGLRLIGIAESRRALEGRIRHMMTRPKPRTARVGAWGLLAILAIASVLLPMARARTAGPEASISQALDTSPENPTRRSSYRVVAPPLTSQERQLAQQLAGLAQQMDERYPQQATHWPAGPGIYHIDDQGRVTAWHYRELWRRSKDCAENEVGWGSSELVNATGMYYLPDGTPLSSRWSERGGGMKDIRVDVGHVVGQDERVGLIHRHRLSEQRDLWSRDGRRRTIRLGSYGDGPVKIVVRIDQPADLDSWSVGDVAADVQPQDGYTELLLSGPPRENRGPMLVTVAMPAATLTGRDDVEEHVPLRNFEPSAVSGTRLMDLDKALRIYADDHDDRFPDRMADAAHCYPINLPWLEQHVVYLGEGKTLTAGPNTVLAYDKTMLKQRHGTLVLFAQSHVDFRSRQELEALGVTSASAQKVDMAVRGASARHLAELGKALLIYANDHEDTFPRTLQEARRDIDEQDDFTWVLANVAYRGGDLDPRGDPARVLAYDRTLLEQEGGTNVLYLDSHVAFESGERLGELGIGPVRGSLPNIFIMSSSHAGFDVFGEVLARTRDWTWNKTGRHHARESYDEIFDGTHNRSPHDILVLVFTLEGDERIPAEYEDLLPRPWATFQRALRQGRTVERAKEARGLHVITLAAPRGEPLKQLIAQSKLLDEAKRLARSPVRGCDLAIDKFEVRADLELGTHAAVVLIRNRGTATCPKLTVNFYRGDPTTARPMSQRLGPIKPGKVLSQSSLPFALREGITEVYVELDPANLIEELDETNNRAALEIVVRDGKIVESGGAVPAAAGVSLEAQVESRTRLLNLGRALLIHAHEHEDKLPDELMGIRQYDQVGFSWLYSNVAYLGQGMTTKDDPERPVAYDKTLIQSGTGTNVLYLNSQVAFEDSARLAQLGIKPTVKSAAQIQEEAAARIRATVLHNLRELALAAVLYAEEHNGPFPDDLEAFKPYMRNESLFAWADENAEYVAKGANRNAGDIEPFRVPLAYWKNPPTTMDGTAVAFLDGHARFVKGERLGDFGIEIPR